MFKLHKERIAATATKTAKSRFGTLCAVVVTSIFLFSSCGGNLNEKTLTVSNVSISGELGNYVKVVDGDYILKPVKGVKDVAFGNENIEIAVKVELVNKYDGNGIYGINIFPVDSKGIEMKADNGADLRFGLEGDELDKLLKGEVGGTAVVSFQWRGSDKTRLNKIMTETTTFKVVSPDNVVNEE